MKESMSITYIFQIVILFILLFTAIMALTINHSNAFGVKDNIVNILETSEGKVLDDDGNLNKEIVKLIESTSYRTTGKCDTDYTGFNRTGASTTGNDATICIKEVSATKGLDEYLTEKLKGKVEVATGDFIIGKYYQIVVFYQLDLPIVKQVYNFSSKAETKVIYKA